MHIYTEFCENYITWIIVNVTLLLIQYLSCW